MIRLRPESNPGRLADWDRGRLADFFLRPPTLTASNFAALWPTDFIFTAIKFLNLLEKYTKNQKADSILKWPHFHKAYLVTIRRRMSTAVWMLWVFYSCIFSRFMYFVSQNCFEQVFISWVSTYFFFLVFVKFITISHESNRLVCSTGLFSYFLAPHLI